MRLVDTVGILGAVVIVTAAFSIVWATKHAAFSIGVNLQADEDAAYALDEAVDRGLIVLLSVARLMPPSGMAVSIVVLGHGLRPTGLDALAPSIALRESVSFVAAAFLAAFLLAMIARSAHREIRRQRDADFAERRRIKTSAKLTRSALSESKDR